MIIGTLLATLHAYNNLDRIYKLKHNFFEIILFSSYCDKSFSTIYLDNKVFFK